MILYYCSQCYLKAANPQGEVMQQWEREVGKSEWLPVTGSIGLLTDPKGCPLPTGE
ncbi:MAG: hypothetical protein KTR26_06480 [Flammeovirgaceae bacterium]|nr:hypothetical protein [Flammeovirgaceae bacterium]